MKTAVLAISLLAITVGGFGLGAAWGSTQATKLYRTRIDKALKGWEQSQKDLFFCVSTLNYCNDKYPGCFKND